MNKSSNLTKYFLPLAAGLAIGATIGHTLKTSETLRPCVENETVFATALYCKDAKPNYSLSCNPQSAHAFSFGDSLPVYSWNDFSQSYTRQGLAINLLSKKPEAEYEFQDGTTKKVPESFGSSLSKLCEDLYVTYQNR